MPACSHCGKEGVDFKRCSVCKKASYCGAACQNANWKRHKKVCAPAMSEFEVLSKVRAAAAAADWRGVLEWEGRLDVLMAGQPDDFCDANLRLLSLAHRQQEASTGSNHALSIIRIEDRRIELLGRLERFRDQGESMCIVASCLFSIERHEESMMYFQRARAVGAAHGFFSVECSSCKGLGRLAMEQGRHEEGVDLLRNALAAAPLSEGEDLGSAQQVISSLIYALFTTDGIDEVEEMIPRYREAAKAESEKNGAICFYELETAFFTARLHEARGEPQEAERQVRALLDLMRENEAAVQNMVGPCRGMLYRACEELQILDPELGVEELMDLVAAERANLRVMGGNAELHQPPRAA